MLKLARANQETMEAVLTKPRQRVQKRTKSLSSVQNKSRLNTQVKDNTLPDLGFSYETTAINNRRYLGNKYHLLSFILETVKEHCKGVNVVADIFAGTGAVSSAFDDKQLITNDIMYSNYICNVAWFGTEKYSFDKVARIVNTYNNFDVYEDNYMTANFSDTYFSKADCSKIGHIRQDIEDKYANNEINARERAMLITSLLYAMDKSANTCGHYDAYRQGVEFDRPLKLRVPNPDIKLNPNNQSFNEDANELVKHIKADLVYIDPPYNSRQYCDTYHLLENVARWEKPEVFGVAKKMDRSALKSDYCTKKATEAFEDLIGNITSTYILLSYNNMAEKGNERSNARITDKDILRILSKKGKVEVFETDYKAFTTGKSDIKGNTERLFLCTCGEKTKSALIKSPMNYTGGKFKLLPQLTPLFPAQCSTFVDLFCGGCDVGININADKVIFNDSNKSLIGLLNWFAERNAESVIQLIDDIIERYGLSRTDLNGYSFYGCDSSHGLAKYNKNIYLKLRSDFNNLDVGSESYYPMLYTLIVYAFNNQIRFNRDGEYNLPVGKRDFNKRMQEKIADFSDRLHSLNCRILNKDFRKLDLSELDTESFVYADPPYLITCASYNEQNGWTAKDEKDLLSLLDVLHDKGIKFALSNVLVSNNKTNEILSSWIEKRPSYRTIDLNMTYSNSNYHRKGKTTITREVLVVNY